MAAKQYSLAEEKLVALTRCIRKSKEGKLEFGFNEWIKAQDGQPMGQNRQTWSAALYLYAAALLQPKGCWA